MTDTQFPSPRVYVLPLKPTPRALEAINRWRAIGYKDVSIWQGFEVIAARYLERNYALPCISSHMPISELIGEMSDIFNEMIGHVNVTALIGSLDPQGELLDVKLMSWRLVVQIDSFRF